MLRIWGRISSINVRKVVLAAQLLEAPFERIDAGAAFGIVATPDYRALNPNSLVPLIEDDGFALWESNVIVRYLCAKHAGGALYPPQLRERFDAERWMDWQQTTLNPAGRDAFVQLIRVPPDKRDPALVAQSISRTQPLLDLLEAHLARRPFMAGDRLTMADLPIACEVHRWRGLPIEHRPSPRLDRWYEGLRRQPAARGVLDLALA
ncbi:MAG TPA: glutathione S-transferase [Ramlibacter sp.]|uniref:glutathione S-transferase family protein n=1 Tax=Ramlibacter sp. TaxID=1917967 RepID=UPI002C8F81C3|nr:glutathione S-transferase [Ramlibacter sp.]HVZ44123.1 glutathione S-transferase [Ramlibacter sp.]